MPAPDGWLDMTYRRFFAMISVSTVIMFGLMYLNTYAIDHVRFSQTRGWMALLMGAAMALVMLGFMWRHYASRMVNVAIMLGSIAIAGLSLYLVRSQQSVDDVAYMKAMIPHHSIAIMTSRRAQIKDPRVRDLADRIIAAQVREIDEMDRLIASLEQSPAADSAPYPPSRR